MGETKIVAVGFHRLKELLQSLAPSYRSVADLQLLDKGFDDAVAALRGREVDVVVAAGSNGAYLRRHLDVPVVLVKVGGFDVMRALARARALSDRIALVTYGDTAAELRQFDRLFGLGVVQRSYQSEDDARALVQSLKADGIEVVVAPGLVADLADEAGLRGVFLYSTDAVREAIDDAVEVARRARIELAKRERLHTILAHLTDGVVAVDRDERIDSVNPVMARWIGRSREELIGQRLSEVAPALSLRASLNPLAGRDAGEEPEQVLRHGQRTLLAQRVPIREQGELTGAVLTCRDALSIQRADRHLRSRRPHADALPRHELNELIGSSAMMAHVRRRAGHCAQSQSTVLVLGESGTGKELLAQGIHQQGPRRHQPFVAINCAAFPETLLESELFGHEEGAFTGARRGGRPGLFEAAHTGSLFLDEIGDMPLALQTRLLRVLQQREILRIGGTEVVPVDVRVIAATHRDLQAEVAQGRFRSDLYYRLNILTVQLPPLRERLEDLPELAAHLWDKVAHRVGQALPSRAVRDRFLARARRHDWPGNVRELENFIERVLAHAQEIESDTELDGWLDSVVPEMARDPGIGRRLGTEPASALAHTLAVWHDCGGDRALACERLGISRTTLWRRLQMAEQQGHPGQGGAR